MRFYIFLFRIIQDTSISDSGSEKGSVDAGDSNRKSSPGDRVSIIFTLKNQVGNLARALQVFQELGINVLHLELSPLEKTTNQVSSARVGID